MELQELEATIRQRRLYLEAQENQIRRNLLLLDHQATQQKANQATITRQARRLKSLETDAETVLGRLRREAERTPTSRYGELQRLCEQAERDVALLVERKKRLEADLDTTAGQLAALDADVIEADTVLNGLQAEIITTKQIKLELERQAGDQADFLGNLDADVRNAEGKLHRAHKFKLQLEKDQDSLGKTLAASERQLSDVRAELGDKATELATLNTAIGDVRASLGKLQTEDSDFRKNLAREKLKLAEDKANLTVTKQALRRELEVKRAVEPSFKLRVSDEPHHFKL